MLHLLYVYLLTVPILLIGDLLWVGFIADDFYNKHLSHLRGPVQWPGAVLFYLIYTLGIIVFVVHPHATDLTRTLLYGVLFGLVTYGVYNFTNHAVLNSWPMAVVVADIIWGIMLTTTVALCGHYLYKLLS